MRNQLQNQERKKNKYVYYLGCKIKTWFLAIQSQVCLGQHSEKTDNAFNLLR